MKKTYKMIDLDCANCARKMEDAIRKIDGVNSVTISFMTQKMTIDMCDDKSEQVLKAAAAAVKKIEPDCRIAL